MTSPEDSFATPRMAAGAVFINDDHQILLVHPTYKDTWDIPGGYIERGESPAAACQRELLEELGIDRTPRSLLAVDWAPHEAEGDKLLFIFDCGDLRKEDEKLIQLDGDELDAWRWVAGEDLSKYLIPRLLRRVHAVLDRPRRTLYLEHGSAPLEGATAPSTT